MHSIVHSVVTFEIIQQSTYLHHWKLKIKIKEPFYCGEHMYLLFSTSKKLGEKFVKESQRVEASVGPVPSYTCVCSPTDFSH